MTYDEATGNTVLFGGTDATGLNNIGNVTGDTWTWDGTTWTQQFPAASPSARFYGAMAYDPATGDVVLFGGADPNGYALGDTWTWDGTTWTQQFPATSPSAHIGAAMAYDPTTGDMVLFGGVSGRCGGTGVCSSGETADTWTWDGTTWTQQFPATSPSARAGAAMAYDPVTAGMVLFGGTSNGLSFLGDTWTWDGTTWTQRSSGSSATACVFCSMAYDPSGGLILYNAASGGAALTPDATYSWDAATSSWVEWGVVGPMSDSGASMTYDEATGEMVSFGGIDTGTVLGATWTGDLNFNDRVPAVITSPSTVAWVTGTPSTFTITTTGTPTPTVNVLPKYGTKVPPWLTIPLSASEGTATISGTPPPGTKKAVTLFVNVNNDERLYSPGISEYLTLIIGTPPVLAPPGAPTVKAGAFKAIRVHAAGYPVPAISETGALPAGMSFTSASPGLATIAGAPLRGTGGVYPITLQASSAEGAVIQALNLTVLEKPRFTSAAGATFVHGQPNTFTVVTTHSYPPAALTVTTPLPPGLTWVDNGDGTATLSGTPPAALARPSRLHILAATGRANVGQSFTLTIS
jgi:hypothetical protein